MPTTRATAAFGANAELLEVPRTRWLPKRSDPVTVYPPDNTNRIQAFHRWLPGVGRDLVVVVPACASHLLRPQLWL